MRITFIGICILIASTVGAAASPEASGFGIFPIRVILNDRAPAAAVTIRNNDRRDLRMQVRVMAWQQTEAGDMTFVDTDDVGFFPRLFTLRTGQDQQVRIAAARPTTAIEKTYRLFVEELPPLDVTSGGAPAVQVRMLARYSIPVFLQPSRVATAGTIDIGTPVDARIPLVFRNTGSVHLPPSAIAITVSDDAGRPVFTQTSTIGYVLAGGARELSIALPAGACAQAHTVAAQTTIAGTVLQRRLDLPRGACGR